jgi:hypothetical protein
MKDNICVFQVVEERIFPLNTIERKWIVIKNGTQYDTIRNPTVQELNFINLILKINKCKFNRKNNKLIML